MVGTSVSLPYRELAELVDAMEQKVVIKSPRCIALAKKMFTGSSPVLSTIYLLQLVMFVVRGGCSDP